MSALQLDIGINPAGAIKATQDVKRGLDDVAGSAHRTEKALEGVGTGARSIEGGRVVVKRTADDMKAAERAFHGAGTAADRMGRVANDNLAEMRRHAMQAAGGVGHLESAMGHARTATLGFAAAATAAMRALAPIMALVGAGAAAVGVVRTSTEFESLGASLRTVTGSAENAERAFAFLRQFAVDTPYGLQQTTEAFIRLQALGLDPSRKALESYGNTASAMGKPIMQFVEAVADAVTGENERLKEFGIRASVDGEKVAYTFQGVTTVIGNNAREIEGYLRRLGEEQFGGAMAEQMDTLRGAFANVGDAFENFQNAIGEGGVSGAIKRVTGDLGDMLAANESVGRSIGAVIGGGINLYADAWARATSAITEAWRWTKATVEVVGALLPTFQGAGQQIAGVGSGMALTASNFLSAWYAAGEGIYSVLNGVIGVGVGAYQTIVASWERLPDTFGGLAKRAANMLIDGLQGGVNGAIQSVNSVIDAVNSFAPEFAQLPPVPPLDLSAYKASLTDAESASAGTVQSIMSAAMSTNYLGEGLNALGAPITAAKARIDEAAAAAQNLGETARLTGEGFQIVPPDAVSGIEQGITRPAQGAASALRDADQAKRALFSEADRLWAQQNPFEAAVVESQRLLAAADDMTNGLDGAQRAALRFEADDVFRRMTPQAEEASNAVRRVRDEFSDLGRIGADAFGMIFDAVTGGGNVLDNIVDGLAPVSGHFTNDSSRLFGECKR